MNHECSKQCAGHERTSEYDADDAGMGDGKVRQSLVTLVVVILNAVVPEINQLELTWCSPVTREPPCFFK